MPFRAVPFNCLSRLIASIGALVLQSIQRFQRAVAVAPRLDVGPVDVRPLDGDQVIPHHLQRLSTKRRIWCTSSTVASGNESRIR